MPLAISDSMGIGAPAPEYITGRKYRSHLYNTNTTAFALTTTATRLYYAPIYIHRAHTFTAMNMYNTDAGDNGEKFRLGLYNHSATNGPGSLVVDMGEITLTGAAAERSVVASCAVTRPGWYWTACHCDSASAVLSMVGIGSIKSDVGYKSHEPYNSLFGAFGVVDEATLTVPGSPYVDTAYAVLASTAVAPTAMVFAPPQVMLVA